MMELPAEDVRRRCVLRRLFSKYQIHMLSILTLVILCGPHHLYGFLINCGKFQNILPPIFFVAIQMIMQPCLDDSDGGIASHHTRRIFIVGSLALYLGVILAAMSEMSFNRKNLLFTLLYGALAGTGAFLVTSLLRKMLQRVFGNRDSHGVEVLMSASTALSQLILPLLLAQIRIVYGGEMTILLMGSILMHTLPLALMLSRPQHHPLIHNLVRYQSMTLNDLKTFRTPQNGMKRWGNMTEIDHSEDEVDEYPMKKITSQGVEILDTIPEEDELSRKSSIEIPEIEIKHSQQKLHTKHEFLVKYWSESWRILEELVIDPFRVIFRRRTLLPGVILKAYDVFIYILMISGLPCFVAGDTFSLSYFDSSILLVLMALPVLLVTLVSIWMEDLLRENSKHWHMAGEICKFIGCIVITSSRTIFFLRTGVLLLGTGQGVFIVLHERLLRDNVEEDTWSHTRGQISVVSGYLVLIFGFFTNRLLENLQIGTIFLIAGLLYSANIFVFSLINYF